MSVNNQIVMNILSKSVNESFARVSVAAFSMNLDPTLEEVAEIKTAVSEAVTNCIVHGYKDTLGIIQIKIQIVNDNVLKIIIKDKGSGIKDVHKAMEPCFTTGAEDRAGMGFTVMESFMDKLQVRSREGKGTTVTMEKRIIKRK